MHVCGLSVVKLENGKSLFYDDKLFHSLTPRRVLVLSLRHVHDAQ